MSAEETILGGGRYDPDEAGFAAMADYVSTIRPALEDRVWAVEGCNGIGHHVDAHSVALVGTRVAGPRPVVNEAGMNFLQLR